MKLTNVSTRQEENPAGFSRHEFLLRDAYATELLNLEARCGITVAQSLDEAIRGYFAARERDMMHGIFRHGC